MQYLASAFKTFSAVWNSARMLNLASLLSKVFLQFHNIVLNNVRMGRLGSLFLKKNQILNMRNKNYVLPLQFQIMLQTASARRHHLVSLFTTFWNPAPLLHALPLTWNPRAAKCNLYYNQGKTVQRKKKTKDMKVFILNTSSMGHMAHV